MEYSYPQTPPRQAMTDIWTIGMFRLVKGKTSTHVYYWLVNLDLLPFDYGYCELVGWYRR